MQDLQEIHARLASPLVKHLRAVFPLLSLTLFVSVSVCLSLPPCPLSPRLCLQSKPRHLAVGIVKAEGAMVVQHADLQNTGKESDTKARKIEASAFNETPSTPQKKMTQGNNN